MPQKTNICSIWSKATDRVAAIHLGHRVTPWISESLTSWFDAFIKSPFKALHQFRKIPRDSRLKESLKLWENPISTYRTYRTYSTYNTVEPIDYSTWRTYRAYSTWRTYRTYSTWRTYRAYSTWRTYSTLPHAVPT